MTKHVIETRPAAGAPAQKTTLEIDWSDCTEETLRAFATQALIVKLQAGFRKNGIPAEAKVKAIEFAPGTRRVGGGGKINVEKFDATAYTPEQRKELVKRLQAVGAAV